MHSLGGALLILPVFTVLKSNKAMTDFHLTNVRSDNKLPESLVLYNFKFGSKSKTQTHQYKLFWSYNNMQ